MKIWQCRICGVVYDEQKGWPDAGIAPGVADHHLLEQPSQFLRLAGLSGMSGVDEAFPEFLG